MDETTQQEAETARTDLSGGPDRGQNGVEPRNKHTPGQRVSGHADRAQKDNEKVRVAGLVDRMDNPLRFRRRSD